MERLLIEKVFGHSYADFDILV